MRTSLAYSLLVVLAACGSPGGEPIEPDAAVPADAAIDSPPPEPKPAFSASAYLSGSLAIDDAGIRPTYKISVIEYASVVDVGLTASGETTSCVVTLKPKFVQFGSGSTETRVFKTVVIDFAASTVMTDKCKWDDAYVLAKLGEQFGTFEIGLAQARFTEDRPYLDVYYDAEKPLPNNTASITRVGAGVGYPMAATGVVDTSMKVQPTPGTLVPALYDF